MPLFSRIGSAIASAARTAASFLGGLFSSPTAGTGVAESVAFVAIRAAVRNNLEGPDQAEALALVDAVRAGDAGAVRAAATRRLEEFLLERAASTRESERVRAILRDLRGELGP